jgi:exopolyphosphatase/guanosine-5'-triphosphate,3'-diphosphate pyrophosphatase
MPRYAAIDIGSNSVRLLAAEVLPGAPPATLASERQVTRLGESVFRGGQISPEAMGLVCGVLSGMAAIYRKLDVAGVRVVATSAVRDAGNQREFLDRAAEAAGAPVEVISGQEEARLIHLGVESRWPHPNRRVLIVDLGGGSAEVILAQGGKLAEAFSRPLGALRLNEAFLKSDPPAPLELHRMDEYIEEKLAPAVRRIGAGGFDRAIVTSASAVSRLARETRWIAQSTADRLRAARAQVRRLYQDLCARDLAARRRVPGIGPRRAEIIIPGVAVFLRVLEDFQLPSIYYSSAGVRDGIVADLAARGVGRERTHLDRDQRRVVERMTRRYGAALPHARQVAALAHTLFESLQPIHRLTPECAKLLEAAAFLHDVGHFISDTGHHKHSAYVVANSDMPGFTDLERFLVATLCRYHRKSTPAARHEGLAALDDDQKRTIQLLTPLLRLADGLDRGHEQRVEEIECQVRSGAIVVLLRSSRDTDLEQWAAERVAPAFLEAYGVPLNVARARL